MRPAWKVWKLELQRHIGEERGQNYENGYFSQKCGSIFVPQKAHSLNLLLENMSDNSAYNDVTVFETKKKIRYDSVWSCLSKGRMFDELHI